MELPFTGGAYTERSTNVNAQKCINLFPSVDQIGAKNDTVLYGTPGLEVFSTLTAGTTYPIRCMHVFGSILYVVSGATVYSVDTDGTATDLGDITTTTGAVFMADNGTEVIIVDGTASGYLITADVLAIIADADFPVASSATYQDGYFIITSSSGTIYISGSYDGTSWDALDFASAEANPDDAVRVLSNSHDLWIFGEKTTEIFYDSGNVDFPFVRISGAVIDIGTDVPDSLLSIDGNLYWFSNKNKVVRNSGYQVQVISTSHIEYQISTYSTVLDAKAFTYTIAGHVFYVLVFPTEDKVWVYDITTGFWHEWQSYSTTTDRTPWGRHRAIDGITFDSKQIVGDYENGILYELKMSVYTDNSYEIRRIRATQVINKERLNVIWHRLEVDFETGVGLTGGVQGEDPQAMLQWSDDGGHTWSNEYWKDIGKVGKYETRVAWKRLGKSRNRILRLTISDPVKVVMLGAYAELEECTV